MANAQVCFLSAMVIRMRPISFRVQDSLIYDEADITATPPAGTAWRAVNEEPMLPWKVL
jgi:hypothetical protein